MKKEKIENWEGKIYDFLSPVNLTMFREERTEKVISFIKELLKSEKEMWLNLTLERIKLKEKKVHYISAFLEMSHEKIRQEANEMGYNKAIEDLEKLKEALKKELKVGENK